MDVLESKVEDYFQDQIRACGGVTLKFTSPSTRGVPDQIALHDGNVYFVEVKAPGETPRPSQVSVHETFLEHGVPVYVVDTLASVDSFIKDVMRTSPKPQAKESYKVKTNMFDI